MIYALAIQKFFARPDGMRARMRLLSAVGAVGALIHVTALVFATLLSPPWQLAALVIYAAALALFGWAWRTTRPSPLPLAFSTSASTMLVTSGPYRFVRHPFYLAYSLTWIGGAAATGNIWVILSAAAALGQYVDAARREEQQLLSGSFGDAYRRYLQGNSNGKFAA